MTSDKDRDQPEKFIVRDGDNRVIEVFGVKLAEASSRVRDAARWTDLALYRAASGKFVCEKIGRSVVVHAPSCPTIDPSSLPRFQDAHPGADPSDGTWWFCEHCGRQAVRDITTLLVERDRCTAIISDEPTAIVESLYRVKDGLRRLPKVSMELLDRAALVDERIRQALRAEVIS